MYPTMTSLLKILEFHLHTLLISETITIPIHFFVFFEENCAISHQEIFAFPCERRSSPSDSPLFSASLTPVHALRLSLGSPPPKYLPFSLKLCWIPVFSVLVIVHSVLL